MLKDHLIGDAAGNGDTAPVVLSTGNWSRARPSSTGKAARYALIWIDSGWPIRPENDRRTGAQRVVAALRRRIGRRAAETNGWMSRGGLPAAGSEE